MNATDVWKYYGEDYNTPDGSTVTGSVVWADEHGHDISGITVIGSEPYGTDDLQYSYDHGRFVVPNTDTTIKVFAKIGGEGNIRYEAKVVINGAGSATLTGLPVGKYTVTENTGWSWRYTCDSRTKSTVLSSAKDNDSVTITNKLDDNKYHGQHRQRHQ